MWKFSQTLLRMLGFTFDIIIMQEVVGGKARIDPATCKRVLEHTAGFFEQFLAQYVEGRVGVRPQVPESESEVLTDRLRRWLASATAGGRPPLCLMGEGGSGKTSAAIALCAPRGRNSSKSIINIPTCFFGFVFFAHHTHPAGNA